MPYNDENNSGSDDEEKACSEENLYAKCHKKKQVLLADILQRMYKVSQELARERGTELEEEMLSDSESETARPTDPNHLG